ncbi:MAG: hypothetical protein AAGA54_06855 [Myxococcota bacterium]
MSEETILPPTEVADRFNRMVLLDDALIGRIDLRTGDAQCRIQTDFAGILRPPDFESASPEATFEPAEIVFRGVHAVDFGTNYQLTSTVVGCKATPAADRVHVDFAFDVTGGTDPDAFYTTFTVTAASFEVTRATLRE